MKGDSPKHFAAISPFDMGIQAIIKFSCLFLMYNPSLLISGLVITVMLFLVD